MAFNIVKQYFFLAIVISFACFQIAVSSDPDILSDFLAPPNVTGQFFTFTRMRSIVNEDQRPSNFSQQNQHCRFPSSQRPECLFCYFAVSCQLSEHSSHPPSCGEASLFIIYGVLDVRFIDTTNKLYTQRRQAGDIFVFPKGLVHYQFNSDETDEAIALSAFGSASAGTVSVPTSVFATGIDDAILAKSFKTDAVTIQKLKAGLTPDKP